MCDKSEFYLNISQFSRRESLSVKNVKLAFQKTPSVEIFATVKKASLKSQHESSYRLVHLHK